jgi:hypothetical protein
LRLLQSPIGTGRILDRLRREQLTRTCQAYTDMLCRLE